VAAAILDLEQRLLRRLGWTYFAKIMQQMYNILPVPGNRSCDQERRLAKIQDGSRLFSLVCSSFLDVGKLQKLWKIQNFV